ncbi:MAG: hypothetical protein ACYCSO_06795 [Cuniculiplasma sp.]
MEPTEKRGRSINIIIGVAIIAVVAIVLGEFVVLPMFHAGGISSSDTSSLLSANSKIPLSGATYCYIKYTSTSSSIVNGSITATNGLYFYIMTPGQYSTYVSSNASRNLDIPSYYNKSIPVSGSFSTHIPGGSWYIVLENPHLNSSTDVTVNKLTAYSLGSQVIYS